MALTKVQAEGVNLADTFAFTGTVSGTQALVLLQTVTASDDATVEIGSASLFTTTYKTYIIYFTNVHVATDNAHGQIRFGIGGSIKSDSQYDFIRHYQYSGSANVSGAASNDATSIERAWGQSIGNNTGESASGFVMVYDPAATDNYKHIKVEASNDDLTTTAAAHTTSGRYGSGQAALTSIQFLPSSGNITSGLFKLYGIA